MPPYSLIFTDRYQKLARQFLRKHPALVKQYQKTLELLELNPRHPSLRLHALSGRLAGLHSISINLSYRITIEFLVQGTEIVLINVGDHEAVY